MAWLRRVFLLAGSSKQSMQSDNRLRRLFLKPDSGRVEFFLDAATAAALLSSEGLSKEAAAEAARLFGKAASLLVSRGVSSGAGVAAFWVPGRIEILGKHTDYAGGLSLVAALERGIALLAVEAGDTIVVQDAISGDRVDACSEGPAPAWSVYPRTVWRRLRQNFDLRPQGLQIGFAGNVPMAAGMSSSSALVVACYLALHSAYRLHRHLHFAANIEHLTDLADYLGHVENGQTFRGLAGEAGAGTFGGSQDHAAILGATPGRLSLFGFHPTVHQGDIALPEGYVFAVACSGVRAEKTGAARASYNRASMLARRLLDLWNRGRAVPARSLYAALTAPDFSLPAFRASLAGDPDAAALQARLDQCYGEAVEVLPAAVEALRAGDLAEWGRLVDRSQWMAERWLGNQVPETQFLAATARRLGALAASAFGAGFGGAVWAMIRKEYARRFVDRWRAAYLEAYPQRQGGARFFTDPTGPGALRVSPPAGARA